MLTNPVCKWLGKKFRFVPMIFFGVMNLPLGPPKPCPLGVVIGSPIKVPNIPNPSSEDLSFYQNILIERLEELFEAHKESHGMAHTTLKIV